MNLFRSEEHARRWPAFQPRSPGGLHRSRRACRLLRHGIAPPHARRRLPLDAGIPVAPRSVAPISSSSARPARSRLGTPDPGTSVIALLRAASAPHPCLTSSPASYSHDNPTIPAQCAIFLTRVECVCPGLPTCRRAHCHRCSAYRSSPFYERSALRRRASTLQAFAPSAATSCLRVPTPVHRYSAPPAPCGSLHRGCFSPAAPAIGPILG